MPQIYGERIKTLRQSRGFSQLDIEMHCALAPGSISRLENSKTNPTKETLYRIALALKLSQQETIQLFAIDYILSAPAEFLSKTFVL